MRNIGKAGAAVTLACLAGVAQAMPARTAAPLPPPPLDTPVQPDGRAVPPAPPAPPRGGGWTRDGWSDTAGAPGLRTPPPPSRAVAGAPGLRTPPPPSRAVADAPLPPAPPRRAADALPPPAPSRRMADAPLPPVPPRRAADALPPRAPSRTMADAPPPPAPPRPMADAPPPPREMRADRGSAPDGPRLREDRGDGRNDRGLWDGWRDAGRRDDWRRATWDGGRGREFDYRRGERLPGVFTAPAYVVSDWGGYGLAPPPAGTRWIRYFDDAVLIDRGGHVIDAAPGIGWEQPRYPYGAEPRYHDDPRWNDEGFDAPYPSSYGPGTVVHPVAGGGVIVVTTTTTPATAHTVTTVEETVVTTRHGTGARRYRRLTK